MIMGAGCRALCDYLLGKNVLAGQCAGVVRAARDLHGGMVHPTFEGSFN
jgi:hypothetical protein